MHSEVTIGQAAAYVGVTIKTVRHYHKLGLVPEPPRDGSGYRRYGSQDLLRLVQVRTLATAGVPLAEIAGLLAAEPAHFAGAVLGIERQLDQQIADLTARRAMLRRLVDGDRALLPDHAVTMLDRMLLLGYSPEEVGSTRDGWVLARALVPDGFDDYLAQFEHVLHDSRLLELTRRIDEAAAWDPDDPRIDALAGDAAEHYLADPALLRTVTGLLPRTDAAPRYAMLAHHGEKPTAAMQRLSSLFESRLRAAGHRIPRPDPL